MTNLQPLDRWVAATDGSHIAGDPARAGWAWAVSKDPMLYISNWNSSGMGEATSYEAELTALVELLRFLPPEQPAEIRMDSLNVLHAATRWRHRWRLNGWRRTQLGTLSHVDLLQEMDELLRGRDLKFTWVRAHQPPSLRDPLNHFVDRAARSAARNQSTPSALSVTPAE